MVAMYGCFVKQIRNEKTGDSAIALASVIPRLDRGIYARHSETESKNLADPSLRSG